MTSIAVSFTPPGPVDEITVEYIEQHYGIILPGGDPEVAPPDPTTIRPETAAGIAAEIVFTAPAFDHVDDAVLSLPST